MTETRAKPGNLQRSHRKGGAVIRQFLNKF